jgi:hypothetical protein
MSYTYNPQSNPAENVRLTLADQANAGATAAAYAFPSSPEDGVARVLANLNQMVQAGGDAPAPAFVAVSTVSTVQAQSGMVYYAVAPGQATFNDPDSPVRGTAYVVYPLTGRVNFPAGDGYTYIVPAPPGDGSPGNLVVLVRYYDGTAWRIRTTAQ